MQVAAASIGPTINPERSSVGHDAALNVITIRDYVGAAGKPDEAIN